MEHQLSYQKEFVLDLDKLYSVPWRKEWHSKHYLIVGDNRVDNIKKYVPPKLMSSINFIWTNGATYKEIIELANSGLKSYPETDVLIFVGFHSDFTKLIPIESDKAKILRSDSPEIDKMVNTYADFILDWEEKYPNVMIIFTLPFMPDFMRFNNLNLESHWTVEIHEKEQIDRLQFLETLNKFMSQFCDTFMYRPFFLNKLFRKQSCRGVTARNDELPFDGPTEDGVHLAPETVKMFFIEIVRYCKDFKSSKNKGKYPLKEFRNSLKSKNEESNQEKEQDENRERAQGENYKKTQDENQEKAQDENQDKAQSEEQESLLELVTLDVYSYLKDENKGCNNDAASISVITTKKSKKKKKSKADMTNDPTNLNATNSFNPVSVAQSHSGPSIYSQPTSGNFSTSGSGMFSQSNSSKFSQSSPSIYCQQGGTYSQSNSGMYFQPNPGVYYQSNPGMYSQSSPGLYSQTSNKHYQETCDFPQQKRIRSENYGEHSEDYAPVSQNLSHEEEIDRFITEKFREEVEKIWMEKKDDIKRAARKVVENRIKTLLKSFESLG